MKYRGFVLLTRKDPFSLELHPARIENTIRMESRGGVGFFIVHLLMISAQYFSNAKDASIKIMKSKMETNIRLFLVFAFMTVFFLLGEPQVCSSPMTEIGKGHKEHNGNAHKEHNEWTTSK